MIPYRILPRMILLNLLGVAALSVVGSSALMMTAGAMIQAASLGIDPLRIMTFMPLLIAPTLPYTVPSCLLLACTMVYGGMSAANEVTAIKAAGIHVGRILGPAILLAAGAWAATVYLVDTVIPACHRMFQSAILADIEGTMLAYLREQGVICQPSFPYELYVRGVQDEKLINVVIKHRTASGNYDMVAKAAEATLKVVAGPDGERRLELRLIDGMLSTGTDAALFRDNTVPMPLPGFLTSQEPKNEMLSFAGLRRRAAEASAIPLATEEDLAAAGALAVLGGNPSDFAARIEEAALERGIAARRAHEMECEVQLRLAQASAPIPFVLLGVPLSILFQRREFLRAFFVCFMPIVTLYYPAMILCFNLVKEQRHPSYLALLWVPSIALSLAAVPFLRRTFRY